MGVEQREHQESGYPFDLPAVKTWKRLAFHEKVTFLVGENGSGKSTLIEAIALAANFSAEGGSRDHDFATHNTHSELHKHIRLVRAPRREKDSYFSRAETFYTQGSYLDRSGTAFQRYGGKSLFEQSHGEGMMSLFWHRFQGNGLYIMDEPEAALSPQKQMSFLTRLNDLVKEGSQFIIATHSPILLSYPNAWIYEIDNDGLLRAEWENLTHVDTMRQFLKYPDKFLEILLEDDDDDE